jgi:sugar phosphate isomerase/epimerase
MKGFLSALVEIGFDGPAYVEPFQPRLREMPPEEALALVAESMKKCLALVD